MVTIAGDTAAEQPGKPISEADQPAAEPSSRPNQLPTADESARSTVPGAKPISRAAKRAAEPAHQASRADQPPTAPAPARSTAPADHPISESFGDDPERYNRARPAYPRELIDRIVGGQRGRAVLDAGCGTGIAARQLQAAGCVVTGVEPDARMAAFAAKRGVPVEIAKFEDWDSAGRTFDILTAGMTWHWVDPSAGAAQAARVVRPGGRVALFWNAFQVPRHLAERFAQVYADLLPEMPMYQHGIRAGKDVYAPLLTGTAERLHEAGFDPVEQWRDEWQRTYTRAEWVDLFPTFGGHALLPRETVAALQEAIGAEVDAAGGEFVVEYATVTVTALRAG